MKLPDRYAPQEVEARIYSWWEKSGYFKASDQSTRPSYCIILPPPNVTGALHLGHALNHSVQDLLIRWKRMSGFNALWMPGTDHAGIATQIVVEKQIEKQGQNRLEMGREKFVEKIWEWKKQYGDTILNQMRRIGDSCDWDRNVFTLDEGVSKAVRKVFVTLYKKNLIYRGTRLVNWDTHLQSAVSDLEVEHQTRKGTLWHIKYQVENSEEYLTVATTRPETLLGDTAVCVNPDDPRYKALIGKQVILPLLKRKIPIVADSYTDQTFGSGVVKMTPAHDFNDYQVAQRHTLKFINILNPDGTLNEHAGAYKGLSTQAARKKVLEDLKSQELLVKEEPYTQSVPISTRTGQVIEPYLSTQWFVKIKDLAVPAQRAVENGTIEFLPEHWTKTYLHWMANIQDWCISRQLWWGHRIPAWHCESCKHITVMEEAPTTCEKCNQKTLKQDIDVLDTWFSSALWPFSTLGWPQETESLKTFYPSTVLVTGHDIIFFWVARMIMMGIYFAKDVPFRSVYITGLIRDEQGKKMSKSVGNSLDPLDLVDKYGADSLRFSLLSQIATGRDLKFSESRLEGYRNFMNKIWNASRFSLSALENVAVSTLPKAKDLSVPDRWIVYKLKSVVTQIDQQLEEFRFSDAALSLYHFVWNDFCDWYLEFSKPIIYGPDSPEKTATLTNLAHALNRVLRLLHPFVPFITEEIYRQTPFHKEALIVDSYPTLTNEQEYLALGDEKSYVEIEVVKEAIFAIRNIRSENQIKPGEKINVRLAPQDQKTQNILSTNKSSIMTLAKLDKCDIGPAGDLAKCAVTLVEVQKHVCQVVVPLEGLVNFADEIKRIQRNMEKLEKEKGALEARLNNPNFLKNAEEDVVESDKAQLILLKEKLQTLQGSVARLK